MTKLKRIQSASEKKPKKRAATPAMIVIDQEKGWIFNSEDELYSHFSNEIEVLESEYQDSRVSADFSDTESAVLEDLLDATLDEPDQIWMDTEVSPDFPIYHFHRMFDFKGKSIFYVASTYLYDEDPTFIFIHFPTRSMDLSDQFRRGQLVFDRTMAEFEPALIEGDGLTEGDGLSLGLFSAMIKVRSEKDIPLENFKEFGSLREETIDHPDEIWRSSDFHGHRLVTFIKEFPDHEDHRELHYVVVTQEDNQASAVHSLLFSFPTTDSTLLERYRNGENLQAEEVIQENSH